MGSLMIVEGESVEQVRKLMESDIYYTSGVVSTMIECPFVHQTQPHCQWDPEKLLIVPFLQAQPK